MHVPVRDLLKVQETHMKMYMYFVHTKRVWPLTYLQVTRGGCPVDDGAGWPSHPMLCRTVSHYELDTGTGTGRYMYIHVLYM